MKTKTTVAAPTPTNHVQIYSAICDMNSTISRAEDLLSRINGNRCTDESADTLEDSPCLLEILQKGPDMIRDNTGRVEQLISQIEDALF